MSWPGLVEVKFGSDLGKLIGQEDWGMVLKRLLEVIKNRKKNPGVSVSFFLEQSVHYLY